MSKQQTTGQPKKKAITGKESELTPNFFDRILGSPQTKQAREEALNRLIQRITVAVVVFILLVLGIALFVDQVVIPNRAVAQVNGQAITVREFRDRVRFERARLTQQVNGIISQLRTFGMDANQFLQQEPYSTWINELNVPDQLGRRVINDMVGDVLVAQQAASLGISVNQDSIQAQINEFFGYDPTAVALIGQEPTVTPTPTITPTPFVSPTPSPTPTSTPTPTPNPEVTPELTAEATDEATSEVTPLPTAQPTSTQSADDLRRDFERQVSDYRRSIRQTGNISDGPIDDFFRREALRQAVAEYLTSDKKNEEGQVLATYVNVRHILVKTLDEANEILAALRAGASFADLARASSTDTGSGANGGELGWSLASNYVAPFEQAVLSLDIGVLSEPVESEFGFHIIQVRAREERPVQGSELTRLQERTFSRWLEELRAANAGNVELFNWTDYVPR
ncbi:MAG: peptidylprolyl isomerase [Anaerolineae bacterium]|nr:peptidylprolyl isomerase [Anaerolineae bacterium]MDW8173176.1 peptidylprolyl isomerase [Anaerolineae bacterium]